VQVARDLLGKYLFSDFGTLTGGMIIETEAYAGAEDRACHAFNNRRTKRTETMFSSGGVAYVYLCYGIHHLLNVVTSVKDEPHAVLIRALLPTHGVPTMQKRRTKPALDHTLTNGPGSLCQALAITLEENGASFHSSSLFIQDLGEKVKEEEIIAGPRIGVEYAKEDALLPWRFCLNRQLKKS
jgi:DNA-3-methyladenine glycosylase